MKQYKVKVNGQEYMVEVEEILETKQQVSSDSSFQEEKKPEKIEAEKHAEANKVLNKEVKHIGDQDISEDEEVKAPMPGKILKINLIEGDSVNEGDVILILEAMKMENEIIADNAGKVKKIFVAINDVVETDDILLLIEH